MPPALKPSPGFTVGNLASIVTTLVSVGGLIWYLSAALQELRGKDTLHEARMERIEADVKVTKSDHDLLIEIRQDLRILRLQFEALTKRASLNEGFAQ